MPPVGSGPPGAGTAVAGALATVVANGVANPVGTAVGTTTGGAGIVAATAMLANVSAINGSITLAATQPKFPSGMATLYHVASSLLATAVTTSSRQRTPTGAYMVPGPDRTLTLCSATRKSGAGVGTSVGVSVGTGVTEGATVAVAVGWVVGDGSVVAVGARVGAVVGTAVAGNSVGKGTVAIAVGKLAVVFSKLSVPPQAVKKTKIRIIAKNDFLMIPSQPINKIQ